MLLLLIFTGFLFKASVSQITGYGDSTAEYGGQAHYKCGVADPAGVLQVTWQRLYRDESIENLATYSKRFGQQVNEPYQEKVIFTEASLHSTSITLKNVTWEDESCYICSFNVYPDGSKRKQTCLTVQGISEVKTDVHAPSSEHKDKDKKEVEFSCSAIGKPTPTIEWTISSGATILNEPQTTMVTNSNRLITSSRNITLSVPLDWSGHVDCLLNKGMKGERMKRIDFSPQGEEEDNKGNKLSPTGVALVISAVVVISCIAVAAAFRQKRSICSRKNINVC